MIKIVLVLDRENNDLWLDFDGNHKEVIWGVTGVKRVPEDLFAKVRIYRKGTQIGNVWDVAEIKERWKTI